MLRRFGIVWILIHLLFNIFWITLPVIFSSQYVFLQFFVDQKIELILLLFDLKNFVGIDDAFSGIWLVFLM